MQISQENAFRPAVPSFFDTLSQQAVSSTAQASQAASTAAQTVQSAAPTAVSTAVMKVPAIFQRKVQEIVPPKVQDKASEAKQEATKIRQTFLEMYQGVLPRTVTSSHIYRHLFTPLLKHQVLRSLPNVDVDRCASTCELLHILKRHFTLNHQRYSPGYLDDGIFARGPVWRGSR
jgi:hypothetical protein